MAGPGAKDYIIIDGFLIDCSLSENHTFDSDVTDYPVESGSSVSDNIRPLPIQVDIEGLVSNTPIGLMREKRASPDATDRTFLLQLTRDILGVASRPTDDAYALFERIRDAREPVTITTSLRTFDNMVMQSLAIPRGDHMDHLRFQAKFKQIITVENKRTIRVSTPIGTGKKKVSKPPNPYDGLIITIDRVLGRWWDPDVATWRSNAFFKQELVENTGSSSVITKWHLYRGQTYPETVPVRTIGSSDIEPGFTAASTSNQYIDSWRKSVAKKWDTLIRVPAAQCVFHDFVVKRTTVAKASDVPTILGNRSR
jgi:hypothetical protein